MKNKTFQNGSQSWIETHHEVVTYLAISINNPSSLSYTTRENEGTLGLYSLAIKLTDEFESLHKGRIWDGDFIDEIDSFLSHRHLSNIFP